MAGSQISSALSPQVGATAQPLDRRTASTTRNRTLLVSELFPPAVGGSAVLFHGIYSRLGRSDVVVLTDERTSPAISGSSAGNLRIVRRSIATRRWGILDPRALGHHASVALQIRALLPRRTGLVHVGRALPEGIAALLARAMGGPEYVCWAHGEDLVTARSSRELTLLATHVYRAARAAVANSHNTARLLQTFGVPAEKIALIHPAVDAARFHPAVDGRCVRGRYAGPDDLVLLTVGRLQRRKGHDVSIQAIHLLRDELPRLRYLIVGDGEERARLEGLVDGLGLRDRVFFAGVAADSELPAYYAACDVFLLPNRVDNGDLEGFGIVFLEAAASGRPVIGGDSGGVPEAVERDVSGLLVEGGTVHKVANAIRRLATSAELRRQMGSAGRDRVERFFTWDLAAKAISDLHDRLVSDR